MATLLSTRALGVLVLRYVRERGGEALERDVVTALAVEHDADPARVVSAIEGELGHRLARVTKDGKTTTLVALDASATREAA